MRGRVQVLPEISELGIEDRWLLYIPFRRRSKPSCRFADDSRSPQRHFLEIEGERERQFVPAYILVLVNFPTGP